jgi:hypothetical protein
MKKEKVILSFIGVAIGLVFAGIAFYLYQSTKVINLTQKEQNPTAVSPTPVLNKPPYIVITSPNDEQVLDQKIQSITGSTIPNSTIILLTKSDQQVLKPTTMGDFSTTVTLENGENLLTFIVIAPDGQTQMIQKTFTFTTEDF